MAKNTDPDELARMRAAAVEAAKNGNVQAAVDLTAVGKTIEERNEDE